MSIHSLGTTSTTALRAVQFTKNMSDSDIAGISGLIVSDVQIQKQAVWATATISSGNANVVSVTALTSGSNIPLTAARAGHWIFGPGIPSGTQIRGISGSTVTMTNTATANAVGANIFIVGALLQPGSFQRYGQLWIPNRGWHKIEVNDYIAVDASGWPIHLSQQAVAYAGSSWTFT